MKKIVYSLMLSTALFATNYEDGMKAFQSKDYDSAMKYFSIAGDTSWTCYRKNADH